MKIIKSAVYFVAFALVFSCQKETAKTSSSISSTNGNITVDLSLENGQAFFSIQGDSVSPLEKVNLGLVLEDADFSENLSLVHSTEAQPINKTIHA